MPREMIHNTTKDFQAKKLCLESTGERSKKEGREPGVSLTPNSHMLNLMGERGMHTKYFQN